MYSNAGPRKRPEARGTFFERLQMAKKEKRGGARKGAGRKPSNRQRVQITISAEDDATARAAGNGNRSAGISAALAEWRKVSHREKS